MGIIGNVLGAVTGANAARESASTLSDASKQGSAAQIAYLDKANAQQQKNLQPYMAEGQKALGQYDALLNGGAAKFDVSKLPGYSFEMQQGQEALSNSAAARGGALSGNTIQATEKFGQGLAATQFGDYMNRLLGLIQGGQSAATGSSQLGTNIASQQGASAQSGIVGAGNATASGIVGVNNAWTGAINNTNQMALGSLFNSPVL